ncbi:hypothetical protein AJ80_09886 [Polytolypa hystricis UAMH7299]|uniref:Uncharacterized protein n=1 Tax=Polytolypa hystricis (strain UAMH7299) TaxID=1447883 RepID=A0A2B7W8V2_POLH7|nr:hypothetical protein AJ80_09886 [Polytolypa hystricis UAMH7299]
MACFRILQWFATPQSITQPEIGRAVDTPYVPPAPMLVACADHSPRPSQDLPRSQSRRDRFVGGDFDEVEKLDGVRTDSFGSFAILFSAKVGDKIRAGESDWETFAASDSAEKAVEKAGYSWERLANEAKEATEKGCTWRV